MWAAWHRQPDATKGKFVAAQLFSREATQEVVTKQCDLAGLRSVHYQMQFGRELAKAFVVTPVGGPRSAARRAAMLLGTMWSMAPAEGERGGGAGD